MPEVRIDKQEAGRDLFNVAGDLIIQHPITHEPVYFPTIQSVLRKGETTEGDFFKKEPEWVDYEQGFIVERKEVEEIIKKLENNKIQLVRGAPASGKSIILKNVGFKLANKNKVYVVELKKHPQDEIKLFFENIPKIDDDDQIFIIDDAHLNISECERLIRNFKGRGKGKLIIGSRETRELTEGDPTETSEFEHLSKTCIRVQAEDATEGMIKTFLKARHHFSDDRIKTVSDNLQKYKKDLWFLSWALKAYDSKKDSLEDSKIYEKIKNEIRKINAEDVFFPLSVFYRFEIPIERDFLEQQMDLETDIINQLIKLSEIVETEDTGRKRMISLNHSSIAELYYGAYQNYPDLGKRVKNKLLDQKDKTFLEGCLFHRYITTTDPRNGVDVVHHLGDYRSAHDRSALLEKLIKDDKIQDQLKEGLEKEEDIEKIGKCVNNIIWSEAEWSVVSTYGEIQKPKIEHIEKIGGCLSSTAKASEKVGWKLVSRIDINALSSKIEKEKDTEKILSCLWFISFSDLKMLQEIVNRIKPKLREELLEKLRGTDLLIPFLNDPTFTLGYDNNQTHP